VRIGQSIHRSQVYAACLTVSGVMAVHGLVIGRTDGTALPGPRYDPGEGRYFQLADTDLHLSYESVTYAR
jgi:hypothetical protein